MDDYIVVSIEEHCTCYDNIWDNVSTMAIQERNQTVHQQCSRLGDATSNRGYSYVYNVWSEYLLTDCIR